MHEYLAWLQPIIQRCYDAGSEIDWIENSSIIKDGTSPFFSLCCKWFTHLFLARPCKDCKYIRSRDDADDAASSVQIIGRCARAIYNIMTNDKWYEHKLETVAVENEEVTILWYAKKQQLINQISWWSETTLIKNSRLLLLVVLVQEDSRDYYYSFKSNK